MNNPFQSAAEQNGLSDADIDLLSTCHHRVFVVPRGSDIGHASTDLHVLMDGWACKYRLISKGRRQILSVHMHGEVCDLDKLFCHSLSYGIQAFAECRVAAIPVAWLKEAIDKRPAIRDLLWSLTVLENVALTELVTCLGSRSARERLAYFLCDLVARLQMRGQALDGTFRSELTQADMADILGLSLVHLNRSMQSLKHDGLIGGHGATYTIIDPERLRELAGYGGELSIARANQIVTKGAAQLDVTALP